MMKIARYILCIGVLIAGCTGPDSSVKALLDRAEEQMLHRPDSSLSLLQSVQNKSIPSRELRARFALLYSQALDKNEIDIASDSIIQVAREYYSSRQHTPEWGKTCYYTGVVAANAGEIEEAMKHYLYAVSCLEHTPDAYTVGLAYSRYLECCWDKHFFI